MYAGFAGSMERNRGLRIDLWSFNLSVIKSDLTSYIFQMVGLGGEDT